MATNKLVQNIDEVDREVTSMHAGIQTCTYCMYMRMCVHRHSAMFNSHICTCTFVCPVTFCLYPLCIRGTYTLRETKRKQNKLRDWLYRPLCLLACLLTCSGRWVACDHTHIYINMCIYMYVYIEISDIAPFILSVCTYIHMHIPATSLLEFGIAAA